LNLIHHSSYSGIINNKRKLILSMIHERHHALRRLPVWGPTVRSLDLPLVAALGITGREREATCT
jgi:hypothetical protein